MCYVANAFQKEKGGWPSVGATDLWLSLDFRSFDRKGFSPTKFRNSPSNNDFCQKQFLILPFHQAVTDSIKNIGLVIQLFNCCCM